MNDAFRSFSFDPNHAKANGAVKTAQIIISGIVYLAVVVIINSLSFSFLKLGFSLQNINIIRVPLLIAAAAALLVIGFIIEPFREAKITSYAIDENGDLNRFVKKTAGTKVTVFGEIQVLKSQKDHWVISYTNSKGKTKSAVIPNAYPGLEEYMKKHIN